MADELELASEREQVARDAAIHHVQNQPPAAIATGECLECGAKLKKPMRWCDNFCHDDWQRWNPEA